MPIIIGLSSGASRVDGVGRDTYLGQLANTLGTAVSFRRTRSSGTSVTVEVRRSEVLLAELKKKTLFYSRTIHEKVEASSEHEHRPR